MDFHASPFEEWVQVKDGCWPAPLNGYRVAELPQRTRITYNGKPVNVFMGPALVNALLIYNRYVLSNYRDCNVDTFCVSQTKSTTYVEYAANMRRHILVSYDKESGDISGRVYDSSTEENESYRLEPETDMDATCFWLAIILAHGAILSLSFTTDNYAVHALTDLPLVWQSLAKQNYDVYRHVVGKDEDPIPLNANFETTNELPLFQGNVPNKNLRVYAGTPLIIKDKRRRVEKTFSPLNPEDCAKMHDYMTRKEEDYTEAERMLIPSLNPTYRETIRDMEIMEEIMRTWKKAPEQRITSFLFTGPAGTGKSATAYHLGALLKIPTVSFSASAGTDETSIFGTIVPVVEDTMSLTPEEKKVANAISSSKGKKVDTELVAEALNLPDLIMCKFDPQAAAELMGVSSQTSTELISLRDKLIKDAVKKVSEKAESQGTPAISYKYIPSTIVQAIENGYLLEIQEPTNVVQQSVFSCLYDVLEKSSIGTIETPMGTVKRHPDFMVVVTCNTMYNGNRPLAGSFKSRLQYPQYFSELSEDDLAMRVMSKVGMTDEELARQCVAVYQAANQRAWDLAHDQNMLATPRALFAFSDCVNDGCDPEWAFKHYILPILSNEEEEFPIIWESVNEMPLFN